MSPLPGPAEVVFYAVTSDGQVGPMSSDQLLGQVAAGRYPEDVPVWWPDAPDWTPLTAQPEMVARLAALRAPQAAPPPPPPPPPAPEPEAPPAPQVDAVPRPESDEELDAIFAGMVRESWRFHHLVDDTARVDEVLLGALITATVDTGQVLIDLTSDGTNHFVRFEDPADRSRLTLAITHLTRTVTQAKTMGQRASVVIGYGEPIKSFGKVLNAIRQEAKSGYVGRAEPGVVTFDADSESQYLYAQVDLYLALDEYIDAALQPDYGKLSSHVAAATHALRKFLHGRISD